MTFSRKHFSKSIAVLLTVVLVMSTWGAAFAFQSDVTDTLDADLFGATSDYTTFVEQAASSDARYDANISVSNGTLHLKNGDNSGIVTRVSGGSVSKVSVHGKNVTLDVYGKNSAYESTADLYDTSKQGDYIGRLHTKGNNQNAEITDFSDSYEYIGIVAPSGANVGYIQIVWNEDVTPGTTYSISFESNGGNGQMETISGEFGNYTVPGCGDIEAPEGKVFIGWKSSYDGVVYSENDIIELEGDLTLTAQWAAEVLYVDEITSDFTGVTTSSYTAWPSGSNTGVGTSGTHYAGTTSTSNGHITIKQGYGIYTTESVGYAQTITVNWRSSSAGSVLVYGKNTPYGSVDDLYDQSNCGTLIATINHGNTSTISLTGNQHYKYIAIASHTSKDKDAPQINSIQIGWEKVQTINEIAQYSIVLSDCIGLRVYMLLDKETAESSDAYMHIDLPDGTSQDISVQSAGRSGDYYYFQCDVSARHADSDIVLKFYDGTGSFEEHTVTVAHYAKKLIDLQDTNAEYKKAAPLAKALLNYCEASRAYFEEGDSAMNVGYEDDSIAEITASMINKPFTEPSSLPEGVTFEGATLSLKSQTTLSLYFSCPEGVTLSFAVSGKTYETTKVGSYQVVRIRGIKPLELGNTFEVTVNGEYKVNYSPLTYCYSVLNGGTYSEALKTVVKSLYNYYVKAEEYMNPS